MPKDNHPVKFEGAEGHRLADMSGVLHDLRTTAGMLAHLFRELDKSRAFSTVAQALFDSAIIHYGRCFNSGARHAFRDVDEWAAGLSDSLAGVHLEALSLRNKHVAHSVNDWELNVPVVRVSVDRKTGEANLTGVTVSNRSILMPRREWLNTLREIAMVLADRTEDAMKAEKARLLILAKEMPQEYWVHRIGLEDCSVPGSRGVDKTRRRT